MPCRCDGYPEPKPDTHNGPLAEMLCEVLQDHEKRGDMTCFSASTLKWWEEHKARDRKRVQADMKIAKDEKARQVALSKLTWYERSLLGLGD